jgi:hypothetical protein
MPNPRAPPVPADLPSAKQQLRRRQAAKDELAQAARRAAQRLQRRFRRAPQTPQEGRNAPAPLRTSPTPNCQRGNPLAPADPTSRLNLPDRRLGQAGPPSTDKGITGAWDIAGPHRPQPTAWSNAAAAATTAASCSRQGPLPRRQHVADPDTDRSTGRTARGAARPNTPCNRRTTPPENYHRSNGNDGSRHHGAEANQHGERCPPVCPARRDTSGLGAKTNLPGSSNTPAGRRRVQCTTRDGTKEFPFSCPTAHRPPNPAPVRRDRPPNLPRTLPGVCHSTLGTHPLQDVTIEGSVLLVKIRRTKIYTPRQFTIVPNDGPLNYISLYNKYVGLRPKNVKIDNPFLSYHGGKCTSQPVGKNTSDYCRVLETTRCK